MGVISSYEKYNKLGNVNIILHLQKVCYYPGENMVGNIKLIPKNGLYQECIKYCEIFIIITQHSQYTYRRGSDLETEEETIQLINHRFRFSDFIQLGQNNEINIPINIILPKIAHPSIFLNNSDYVKHFITIEYPYFNVKRTHIFIVKNNLNFHSKNRSLLCPFKYQTTFNKKKFFKKKGSCKLVIEMPRNYFLYNEKVGYNIHLDCRILEIPVYKISVTFCRTLKKKYKSNYLRSNIEHTDKLFFKDYNLNKNEKLFNIIDYIYFSAGMAWDKTSSSPTETYKRFDCHGLYEINDQTLKNLYPSCSVGLINIEYSLRVKIYFDTILTTDEKVFAPLDFCDILDFNNPNGNNINQVSFVNNSQLNMPMPNVIMNNSQFNMPMSNELINNSQSNLPMPNVIMNNPQQNKPMPDVYKNNSQPYLPMSNTFISNSQTAFPKSKTFSNNSQTNINNHNNNINLFNNNSINDMDIGDINNMNINEGSAPPSGTNLNIDEKKNYLEDKKDFNLSDWVIIDKKNN